MPDDAPADPLEETRRCPDCSDGPLQLRTKPNRWVCVACGAQFRGEPPDELVRLTAEGDEEG